MRECSLCHEDFDDIDVRYYSIAATIMASDGRRRTEPVVCGPCVTNRDRRLIFYCHSCESSYYSDWIDQGTSNFRAVPCKTHSADPAEPRVRCIVCGPESVPKRIDSIASIHGDYYCTTHWEVRLTCAHEQCGKITHSGHPDAVSARGMVYCSQTCVDRPWTPHWFPPGQTITTWEVRDGCECRPCLHVKGEDTDHRDWDEFDDPHSCDSCSWTMEGSDSITYYDDSGYCHPCELAILMNCSSCGDITSRDARHRVRGVPRETPLCLSCIENSGNYWRCDAQCSAWYRVGTECECGGVHRYNYAPLALNFMVASSQRQDPDHTPYLGFELEIEAIGPETSRPKGARMLKDLAPWAYAVHDGTLLDGGQRGFEIVTHPFTFQWFKEHWDEIKAMLTTYSDAGYRSWEGGRCGMHIHISRLPMTDAHQMKFMRFIYGSSNLAMCIGQRSHGSPGLQRYAPFDKEDRSQFMQKIRRHRNPGVDGHYAALNANKAATLEGRWFRGTLNPIGFRKNIEFMHSAWEFTRKFGFSSSNEMNYIEWLRGTPERRDYAVLLDYIERNYITRR